MQFALTLLGTLTVIQAFSTSRCNRHESFSPRTLCQLNQQQSQDEQNNSLTSSSRRDWIASSLGLITLSLPSLSRAADPVPLKEEGVTMYKTTSGLKYIELEAGDASSPSPKYGQLCIISYTGYLKLPDKSEKEKFDFAASYVLKHGNGRMVPGLDEGLHTMKKGGFRRIIIPPKLGFVSSGLGPLPEKPWNRFRLNRLIDTMIAQQGGSLVYDVRLLNFFDDEADQGYYEDEELSVDDFEEIKRRLNRGGMKNLT
jgi:hypothetical protein